MKEDKSSRLQIYIFLINCQDYVKTYEDIDYEDLEPIDFGKILQNRFRKYIKIENGHMDIITPDCWVYCGTSSQQLTVSKQIDIYGEPMIYEFIDLAKENDWKIFAPIINGLIDLNFPEKYSYLEYVELNQKK